MRIRVSAAGGSASGGKGQGSRVKGLFIFPAAFSLVIAMILAGEALAGEVFIYKSQGRRDPMVPLVTPQGLIRDMKSSEKGNDFYLEGIIYDAAGKSLAIINGQIVKTGDEVGGAKISDIRQDRVIIIKDNQAQEIKLEREEGE